MIHHLPATLVTAFLLLAWSVVQAQPYTFTTLAGRTGLGFADGTGAAAKFDGPSGAAIDAAGNLYIADSGNRVIRRITPAGVVTTFAGSPGVSGTADGTGSAARFVSPSGIAIDSSGNLYVTDASAHTLRQITPAGVVTTLAGAPNTRGSADGTGSAARFDTPGAIAIDGNRTIYLCDRFNHTIRRISIMVPEGPNPEPVVLVSTYAGVPGSPGTTDGDRTVAQFRLPNGLAFGTGGFLYVADTQNHTIRRISAAGVVSTFSGSPGTPGGVNNNGPGARFRLPGGLAFNSAGNLLVAEGGNQTIRRISPEGDVTTLAGAFEQRGTSDGTGAAARFNVPAGLAVDAAGNAYVADNGNYSIRRVTSAGVVTTFAGYTSGPDHINGPAASARFNDPSWITVDRNGVVYVSEYGNKVIRRIAPGGTVTTLAGTPGVPGTNDGTGGTARFESPSGSAVDPAGNLFVADSDAHTIRRITPAGVVSTFAGTAGVTGLVDGAGPAAAFHSPYGLTLDSSGTMYVTQLIGSAIRRITPAGVVTTLSTPGQFDQPWGIAADGAGNLYVADQRRRVIKRISTTGVVTTLAGTEGVLGFADGTGAAAQFRYPAGLACDGTHLYVADVDNHVIRRITLAGAVTTIAGLPGTQGSSDGTGTAARFRAPYGVAVDTAGNVYVADYNNNVIRWGAASLPTLQSAPTANAVPDEGFRYNVRFTGVIAGPYEATGLPSGFAINPATGEIAGRSSALGVHRVTLRATNGAGTGSAQLTINVGSAPVFTTQPRSLSADAGGTVTFRVVATGVPAPTYQWRRNGTVVPGATSATLTIPNVSAADAGTYTALATNSLGFALSREATLRVVSGFPTFSSHPADQQLVESSSVMLTAAATGTGPFTYQWLKDGAPILGATSTSLELRNVTSVDAGEYEITATNAVGTAISNSATVAVRPASALANLSVRTTLAAGQTLIVGAVVRDGDKNVLVRAAGPALAAFNLTGVADPSIELYNGPTLVAANNDWDASLAPTFASLGAFTFPPGSRDSALQQSLSGAVTFQARATGPGVVLVEAYDATGGLGTRLANLSARSRVGTGADILIAGFNVAGTNAKQVLIRAVGPGLAAFNVTGFLADPALTVVNLNTGAVIASNNDWSSTLTPTFTRVGAFPLTVGSRDAALLVTLPAGASYTVQVDGVGGGTGEALIEIYEVF